MFPISYETYTVLNQTNRFQDILDIIRSECIKKGRDSEGIEQNTQQLFMVKWPITNLVKHHEYLLVRVDLLIRQSHAVLVSGCHLDRAVLACQAPLTG